MTEKEQEIQKMRKDFGVKTWVYPQPVQIIATYDENGKPDIMNAAWGGMSNDEELFICLSADHKTTKNLQKTKAFTVSFGTKETVVPCDYVGIVSANKVSDKVEKSGFTLRKADHVNAPLIEELPLCIECELISYEEASCHLFGRIVNVSVDESILTNGKVDPEKFHAIVFDPCNQMYMELGKVVARAFQAGAALK
jgi:flavin reductase (DIM6/NTAB) family NADH-FMN oxidoreductase RutF